MDSSPGSVLFNGGISDQPVLFVPAVLNQAAKCILQGSGVHHLPIFIIAVYLCLPC